MMASTQSAKFRQLCEKMAKNLLLNIPKKHLFSEFVYNILSKIVWENKVLFLTLPKHQEIYLNFL